MSMKLDLPAIESYARQYAAKVCDDFFNRMTTINGQQILKLSNVAQVNMFVVSDLFERWKTDIETFKSPFFNFEHQEVKDALKTFMNAVSQHIMVKREDFEPMLTNAVNRTLVLLLDPSKHFDDYVRDSPDFTLTKDRLAQLSKYTKINGHIPKALTDKLGDEQKVYVTTALGWLNDISEAGEFENPDKYLEILSTTVPLRKEDLVKSTDKKVVQDNSALKMQQSFFDLDPDDEELDDEDAPLPTVAQVQAKFEQDGPLPDVKLPGLDRLNDTFTDDLPTVNDLLKKEVIGTGTPLSDLAFSRPIRSIVDGVSLNQKFVFIGRLFEGDINAYNKAVEDLDNCINFSDAKNLMNKALAPKYNWIMAAEEANDFLEVVGRKFQ
jgi:hypothetical protein